MSESESSDAKPDQAAVELHRRGRFAEAVVAYEAEARARPADASVRCNMGAALGEMGQADDAIAAFRTAISLDPSLIDAYNNLAIALVNKGRRDEAIETLRSAVRARPDSAVMHNRLGEALRGAERHAESVAAFQAAVRLAPNFGAAYDNLGSAFRLIERVDEAIAAYTQAVRVAPGFIQAHVNLGRALSEKGRLEEAIAQLHAALTLDPRHVDAYYSIGVALNMKADYAGAMAAHDRVIALNPDYRNVCNNRATTLRNLGRLDESLASHAVALARAPNHADARLSHAHTLLLKGDFAKGLPEYEWRLKIKKLALVDTGASPRWDGAPLDGKTILLHAEQGMGDTIQFIRYAPLLAAKGARVVVACLQPMLRLLSSVEGVSEWVDTSAALPAFDVHCPLPSLPATFGTTPLTVPADVSYIRAEAGLSAVWREKIAVHAGGAALRVGLVWRGNPRHGNDRNRSMPSQALASLAGLPGVHYFSLQKDASEKPNIPAASFTDITAELRDFADTAAMMDHLDLIVTVDTSVAHLAGAMGRPVWTLLAAAPDWRWMLNRDDSVWYPTMRLFRQRNAGDWADVVARVRDALTHRVAELRHQ